MTFEELRERAQECNGCSGGDWPTGCEICELRYRAALWERAAYDVWARLAKAGDHYPKSFEFAREHD